VPKHVAVYTRVKCVYYQVRLSETISIDDGS
jgi:hypothetical protein